MGGLDGRGFLDWRFFLDGRRSVDILELWGEGGDDSECVAAGGLANL